MGEWEAWQILIEELRRLKVEINDQDVLNEALINWGEKLVIFRAAQSCAELLKDTEQ
jgi:hypothetical protein